MERFRAWGAERPPEGNSCFEWGSQTRAGIPQEPDHQTAAFFESLSPAPLAYLLTQQVLLALPPASSDSGEEDGR